MNIQKYSKRDIALNQIETALWLFFEGRDLFSVIALAGAAEELLGELLRRRQGALGAFKPLFEMLRPGKARKGEREPVVVGETEALLHTDPRQEAIFLVGRAIDDYQAAGGALTPAMQRFNLELRGQGT